MFGAALSVRQEDARVKRCRHCDRTLPLDAFPPNPRMSSGRGSWCRECSNAAGRALRRRRAAESAARAGADLAYLLTPPPDPDAAARARRIVAKADAALKRRDPARP
jgi:hypothetical protein